LSARRVKNGRPFVTRAWLEASGRNAATIRLIGRCNSAACKRLPHAQTILTPSEVRAARDWGYGRMYKHARDACNDATESERIHQGFDVLAKDLVFITPSSLLCSSSVEQARERDLLRAVVVTQIWQ